MDGKLIPEAYEVPDLKAHADITPATGQLCIPGAEAKIKAAGERVGWPCSVNHQEYIINGAFDLQEQRADMVAFIERLPVFMCPMRPIKGGIIEMIGAVGTERAVPSADLGQVHNHAVADKLPMSLRVLLEMGFPVDHLEKMVKGSSKFYG